MVLKEGGSVGPQAEPESEGEAAGQVMEGVGTRSVQEGFPLVISLRVWVRVV